ncbi:hypothetical protein K523DRAFT_299349 [Schizophyllum commune Tattone D]|nr:hypothetical protein K523DRAFT_299349 [Schizophyllum commune Tattone D]
MHISSMNPQSSTHHSFCSDIDAELLEPEFFASMVHWDEYSGIDPSYAQVESALAPTQEAIPAPDLSALYETPRAVHCVSTAFNAVSSPSPHHAPDIRIVSSDGVHFFVDTSLLRQASSNDFAGTLQLAACVPPTPGGELPCVYVPDSAVVLNVLVHVAYSASPSSFKPSLEILESTVKRLPAYGMDPRTHVVPGTVLFETLRGQAALAPMKVYALAAAHDLLGLAQVASAYLLSYPMYSLSDQEVKEIGPTYLRRLFMLHHERVRILKELLDRPPEFHAETADCKFNAQKGVARGWSAATRLVMIDAGPGLISSTLQHKLGKLKEAVSCPECRKAIDARIWQVVVEWTMTPTTI